MQLPVKQLLFGQIMLASALIFTPLALDQLPNIDTHSQAFAKNGNGGGNSGGNGGGNGTGGNNGGSNNGKSAENGKGLNGNTKSLTPASAKNKSSADKLKGSLNAAHASATARKNAAAHSRVGQIATYERLALATSLTEQEAADIDGILDQLDDPDLTNQQRKALQQELADIARDLPDDGITDPASIDTLARAAETTLEGASNKSLDDENKMLDAVNNLLGIKSPNAVVDTIKNTPETIDDGSGIDSDITPDDPIPAS